MLAVCGNNASASGSRSKTSRPLSHRGFRAESTCETGNQFRFVNSNTYPVWLGEAYQGKGDLATNTIVPPDGNWKMPANHSDDLCMPAGWSGRFWPRTECQFDALFDNDKGYKECTATSQCGAGHVCYGGMCMLDCTSGDTPFCQGATGLNNQSAICLPGGFVSGRPIYMYAATPRERFAKPATAKGCFNAMASGMAIRRGPVRAARSACSSQRPIARPMSTTT
ncbi:MAG: thaumatin family protein [Candidatus Binataceae bacterium]